MNESLKVDETGRSSEGIDGGDGDGDDGTLILLVQARREK
jgi:hypothetical protein